MSKNQPPHGDARADQLLLPASVEISADQCAQVLSSLEGIPMDTDITLSPAPIAAPTAEELAEYEALRGVYEQARGVLRCDGVDMAKSIACRDGLIDAIEVVEQIDGGNWEPTPADGPPTESVLIEGLPYTVPAPVAAELLRLHLELKGGGEPVGGQSRFASDHWGACTVEHVRMVQADPSYAAKGYEARYIYARPYTPPPAAPPADNSAELERLLRSHIDEIEKLLPSRQ